MGFTRSALLKPEIEVQLAEQMLPEWNKRKSAEEIARILNFGKPTITVEGKEVDNPYARLKKFHVWNYRTKFNKGKVLVKGKFKNQHLEKFKNQFPKHSKGGTKNGKHRYDKSELKGTISYQEFKARLNKECPYVEYDETLDYTKYVCRKRAYLILHYWSPLRKAEILERTGADFEVKGEFLVIDLYRKKKFYSEGADTEPFNLLLDLPMTEEVVEWVSRFDHDERPFNFSSWTAWTYVKDIFPRKFPHFWRFNWITKAVKNSDDPSKLITMLLEATGLDIQTVMGYIMADPRYKGTIARRELEILKAQGVI